MQPLIAFNLWPWIEQYRRDFEPPVGNTVIWEDSPFTAMIIRGPHARRDFHVDPSDELFDRLTGNMILEDMHEGQRQAQVIRSGERLLTPALTPHSPHRPADTWGLVVEVMRTPEQPAVPHSPSLPAHHHAAGDAPGGRGDRHHAQP
jgi:3-hydroxyanthranilate 3,4-dioxygenase